MVIPHCSPIFLSYQGLSVSDEENGWVVCYALYGDEPLSTKIWNIKN